MPNIQDLFHVPTPPQGDDEFAPVDLDPDVLMAEFEKKIAGHAERMDAQPPGPGPDVEGGIDTPPVVELDAGAEGTPPSAPDPWMETPEAEREGLLRLRDALADPDTSQRILQVLDGPPAVSPPTTPPRVQVPEPQVPVELPDEIIPGTAEAVLFSQQAEILAQQKADAEYRRLQHEATLQADTERASFNAATQAGNTFARRWAGKLEPSDVAKLAQQAGSAGLPSALAKAIATQNGRENPTPDDFQRGCEEALEVTLLRDEELRGKALSPVEPQTPGSKRTPADQERQNKATAVSTAASPAAPAPTRPTLTARADGKFDPESRGLLIQEFARQYKREREGG